MLASTETLQQKTVCVCFTVGCQPHQVHIAYGDKVTEMVVMWSTLSECSSEVHYGSAPFDLSNIEQVTTKQMKYLDANVKPTYLHRAVLKVLPQYG